jgi:hypothetical protein
MNTAHLHLHCKYTPFPTAMLSAPDTITVHPSNVLPLMYTAEPLALPRNNTDKQPPPETELLDERLIKEDEGGKNARTLFSVIWQSIMVTLNISKAAIAPPQLEHG